MVNNMFRTRHIHEPAPQFCFRGYFTLQKIVSVLKLDIQNL